MKILTWYFYVNVNVPLDLENKTEEQLLFPLEKDVVHWKSVCFNYKCNLELLPSNCLQHRVLVCVEIFLPKQDTECYYSNYSCK